MVGRQMCVAADDDADGGGDDGGGGDGGGDGDGSDGDDDDEEEDDEEEDKVDDDDDDEDSDVEDSDAEDTDGSSDDLRLNSLVATSFAPPKKRSVPRKEPSPNGWAFGDNGTPRSGAMRACGGGIMAAAATMVTRGVFGGCGIGGAGRIGTSSALVAAAATLASACRAVISMVPLLVPLLLVSLAATIWSTRLTGLISGQGKVLLRWTIFTLKSVVKCMRNGHGKCHQK